MARTAPAFAPNPAIAFTRRLFTLGRLRSTWKVTLEVVPTRLHPLKGGSSEGREEEHPDPYGEGAAKQGSPTFYGYNSVADVRPAP